MQYVAYVWYTLCCHVKGSLRYTFCPPPCIRSDARFRVERQRAGVLCVNLVTMSVMPNNTGMPQSTFCTPSTYETGLLYCHTIDDTLSALPVITTMACKLNCQLTRTRTTIIMLCLTLFVLLYFSKLRGQLFPLAVCCLVSWLC